MGAFVASLDRNGYRLLSILRGLIQHRPIVAVATVGLLLRIAALLLQGPAASDWDGLDYARIAQNLHDGIGNVQLRDVPNVLHAPLYPILMAALLFVVRSPELAGIAISVLSGTLLIVFVYRFTLAVSGAQIAIVAAILTALYPLLIEASIDPLSEALFMALAFAGLDSLVRALQRPSIGQFTIAGFCFGCAYLTREQGFAYVVIAVAALLVMGLRRHMPALRMLAAVAALTIPFILCAAPYVSYIARATGHPGLESKSVSNYGVALALSRGSTYVAAADAIGPHLEDVGVEMGGSYPFSDARVPIPSLRDHLRLALLTAPRHVLDIFRVLCAPRHGTVLFAVFTLIGAVAAFRSSARYYHLIILGCLLAEFAALLTIYHFWPRYADPFAALMLPWTAGGLVVLWRLVSRVPGADSARMATAAWAIAALGGAVWYGSTVEGLRHDAADPTLFRDAGAWMARYAPHGSVVMAVDPVALYYGGDVWRALPYADSATALRYIASRHPGYIVIDTLFADKPYLPRWIAEGIPDPRAKRVFEEQHDGGSIDVYRWTGSGSGML